MSELIVTPSLEAVNEGAVRKIALAPSPRPRRVCCWCNPPHELDPGEPGALISHGLCADALARATALAREREPRDQAAPPPSEMKDWSHALRLNAAAARLASAVYYARAEVWGGALHFEGLSVETRQRYVALSAEFLQTLAPARFFEGIDTSPRGWAARFGLLARDCI